MFLGKKDDLRPGPSRAAHKRRSARRCAHCKLGPRRCWLGENDRRKPKRVYIVESGDTGMSAIVVRIGAGIAHPPARPLSAVKARCFRSKFRAAGREIDYVRRLDSRSRPWRPLGLMPGAGRGPWACAVLGKPFERVEGGGVADVGTSCARRARCMRGLHEGQGDARHHASPRAGEGSKPLMRRRCGPRSTVRRTRSFRSRFGPLRPSPRLVIDPAIGLGHAGPRRVPSGRATSSAARQRKAEAGRLR